MMLICDKQSLSNIWTSIHEKVEQHWGWVELKISVAYKKACILLQFFIFQVFKEINEILLTSISFSLTARPWTHGFIKTKYQGGSLHEWVYLRDFLVINLSDAS